MQNSALSREGTLEAWHIFQLLGLGAGFEIKVLQLPIDVTYGFAPLVPRGTLRSTPHGGHEVLIGTFLAF